MKIKYFISYFSLLSVLGANAQNSKQALQHIEKAQHVNEITKSEPFLAPKIGFEQKNRTENDTIPGMYWDFADGFPADWTRADQSIGQIGGWQYTTTAPQGQFSTTIPRINSTSRDNGFMILDGDYYNPGTPPGEVKMNAYMQTPVLDLSNYTDVKLHFQYYFRFCCNANEIKMNLGISADGGNTFTNIDFRDGLPVNLQSENAINKNINISALAAGQENVVIRFHVSDASHYFWMIDDVAITQSATNDMVLLSRNVDVLFENGGFYTQFPYSQQMDMTFKARGYNNGAETQNNTRLNITVIKDAEEVYNAVSSTQNVQRLDTANYVISNTFIPDGKGNYAINFLLQQDQEDQNPLDNMLPAANFTIGDTILARDDGNLTGLVRYSTSNYVGGDADGARATTVYDCPSPGKLKSLSVYIFNDEQTIGTSFKGIVYELTPNGIPNAPLLQTEIVDINDTTDLAKWMHIPFITDGELEIIPADGASYLVGVEVYGVGPLNDNKRFSIGAERRTKQPQRTTYVYAAGGTPPSWGFTENGQPLIRLNLEDPLTNTVELSKSNARLGQNFPNPANQNTTVDYYLPEFTAVNIELIDITGKLITTYSLGNQQKGKYQVNLDIKGLEPGIYFYSLKTKQGIQTKSMVITQ